MLFELIPISQPYHVEGQSEAAAVGEFRGQVLAIGIRGSDPIAEAAPEPGQGRDQPEGLLGWGETYLFVADPEKPAPVWVAKDDVTAHRLPDARESPAPAAAAERDRL